MFHKGKVADSMWNTASVGQKAAYEAMAEELIEQGGKNGGDIFLQALQRRRPPKPSELTVDRGKSRKDSEPPEELGGYSEQPEIQARCTIT